MLHDQWGTLNTVPYCKPHLKILYCLDTIGKIKAIHCCHSLWTLDTLWNNGVLSPLIDRIQAADDLLVIDGCVRTLQRLPTMSAAIVLLLCTSPHTGIEISILSSNLGLLLGAYFSPNSKIRGILVPIQIKWFHAVSFNLTVVQPS